MTDDAKRRRNGIALSTLTGRRTRRWFDRTYKREMQATRHLPAKPKPSWFDRVHERELRATKAPNSERVAGALGGATARRVVRGLNNGTSVTREDRTYRDAALPRLTADCSKTVGHKPAGQLDGTCEECLAEPGTDWRGRLLEHEKAPGRYLNCPTCGMPYAITEEDKRFKQPAYTQPTCSRCAGRDDQGRTPSEASSWRNEGWR